jgi:ribosomal protein S18 acetylase RimI-like enzyme
MPATPVRPLEPRDVAEVHAVSVAAFTDLARRLGSPPEAPRPVREARIRIGRLLATDPTGAWVAERDGRVVGCAIGIMRDGVWGLSMLAVHPAAQSRGLGRELLARAWEHGDGARGRIVLASADARALRSYARLGLELHPAIAARGRPRGVRMPPEVRRGTVADLPLTEDVDRTVRGAAHGGDVEALLDVGGELLVLPGRGYAVTREGTVRLLAARDPGSAAALLRACLAAAEHDASVEWITARQGWAVGPCLDAGLDLRFDCGAVFTAGDVGPFRPYLPSGTYL